MKQPKLKLDVEISKLISGREWFVDVQYDIGDGYIGIGKSKKTALRGAIRNLEKLLAEAEKRLEELE